MKRVTLSLHPDQYALLKNRAHENGRSISSEINQLIDLALTLETKRNIEFIKRMIKQIQDDV